MPVLLNNYRRNDFSKRCTVYSKLKRITTRGFDTSNDYYAGGNFGILQGLNDNSKDYFSLECNDIIKFGDLYVACGQNAYNDQRKGLSTFLYSKDDGVSWIFSNDTFGTYEGYLGYGKVLIVSNNTLFCGGGGIDSNGNRYGLMSSTDGKTWETVNSLPIDEIYSMATNGSGEIVAYGFNSPSNLTQPAQYSIDNGITWNPVPNITITPGNDTVKIVYANDKFYIGTTDYNTNALTVYTSIDLTNWSTVTLKDSENNSITQLPADLNGVYYSSANNLDIYILYLTTGDDSNIQPVFYSSDGVTFTASTGITFSNANVTNVTYNDNDNDSSFYLSVSYNDNQVSQGTPIMYKSTDDGKSWAGISTITDLSSGLPSTISGDVTGISQFFIKDSTTIIACGIYEAALPFGLVSISLSDYTVSSYGKSIVLDNGVTKLFHEDGTILVGVFKYPTADNTIYYYDDTSRKLVATEHQDDL